MNIAHSKIAESNLFHVIILSFTMYFYIWLSKNFSKPTSKNGEGDCEDWMGSNMAFAHVLRDDAGDVMTMHLDKCESLESTFYQVNHDLNTTWPKLNSV